MDESRLFSNRRGRLPRRETVALADFVLKHEKKKLPVNIIFADDAFVTGLNARFRRKRLSTDVLSFEADPDQGILGEIYISIDTARRQAAEYGVTLREEILRLACHGVLHLCGFDHRRKRETAEMRAKEDHYLSRFL